MSLSKDLENLKYVKDFFSQLAAGRHIDASADAARLSVLFDDATGIDAVMTEGVNNKVFDLQGRCVAQPTRGLYIMNGKKIIIK